MENGVCFSSIQRILPLCARRSWRIWQINTRISGQQAVRSIRFPVTPIMCTKRGMMPPPRIQKIQYPMLADPTHALAKDFQVYIESDGVAERGSFLVNPEGKIVAYEVTAGKRGKKCEELFRRVQASQFVAEHGDEVCPAKWQPGAETLKPSLDLVGQL